MHGKKYWVAFAIDALIFNRFHFLVDDRLDLHITLGYVTVPDGQDELFTKRMFQIMKAHWRPWGRNEGSLDINMNVYGTQLRHIWRFTRDSMSMDTFLAALNFIHEFDPTQDTSFTNTMERRVLHLSAYDDRQQEVWLR